MGAPNNPGGHVAIPSIAQGSNRVNSSSSFAPSETARTSQLISNVIAPSATLVLPCSGTRFYFAYSSGAINVRPNGGVFNTYVQGTGLALTTVANAFVLLEIQNPNTSPVLFQIFVGWDNFIDNRLILQTQTQPQVAFPTSPVTSSTNLIAINDLSTTKFFDINGAPWFGVSRTSILITNFDAAATYLLQAATPPPASSASPAIMGILPAGIYNVPVQGNYVISTYGGGNINCVVSEVYTAISAVPVVLP